MVHRSATLLAAYAPSPFATVWTVEFIDRCGAKQLQQVDYRFGRSLQELEGMTVDFLTSSNGQVRCVTPAGQFSDQDLRRLSRELTGEEYV